MATSAASSRDVDVGRQLVEALRRRKWQTVIVLLREGQLDPEQHKQAVQQVSRFTKEYFIIKEVLKYTKEEEMECVLQQMLSRDMWEAIGHALEQGINKKLHGWVVEEACKRASDNMLMSYILRHCGKEQIDHVLSQALSRGLWRTVGALLGRGLSEAQRDYVIDVAAQNSSEYNFIWNIWHRCNSRRFDHLFKQLMRRGFTNAANDIYQTFVLGVLCRWAEIDNAATCSEDEFWKVVNSCSNDEFYEFLYRSSREFKGMKYTVKNLEACLHCDTDLCRVFSATLIHILGRKDKTRLGGPELGREIDTDRLQEQIEAIRDDVISFLQTHHDKDDSKDDSFKKTFQDKLKSWNIQLMQCFEAQEMDQRSVLTSMEKFVRKYSHLEGGYSTDKRLFEILCCVPLFVDMQRVSLTLLVKDMLDENWYHAERQIYNIPQTYPEKWRIIRNASLSHVGEQVRRELFQAAVKLKEWAVVQQWADHSLYDDQRGWALQEAFREKRWDVFLQLADHGLTDSEARRVHYRLAKYADWTLVRRVFETGADITEITELLEGTFHEKLISESAKRRNPKGKQGNEEESQEVRDLRSRWWQLSMLQQKLQRGASRSFGVALKRGKWRIVLCRVIQSESAEDFRRALEAAREQGAWSVVMRLVKLGMDAAQRNSLFPEMLRQQRWGVCRELLDKGVSVQLCLAALPELMKLNQWTLVARVMEYDIGDDVRRRVLETALDRREGSVVWQALSSMDQPVSEAERRAMFQRARRHKMWQTMRPLMEATDSTGLAHRDTTMLDALRHRQWDVVEHCERLYADINIKDSYGRTALQTAIRKLDFEGVEGIVRLGGDQFPLDDNGCSVLHYASGGNRWKCTKTLIQFHGNINQPDPRGQTPLQNLIEHKQAELIDCCLFWGQDVSRGVSRDGETALHACCRANYPGILYYLVCRGVDPLAVSRKGQSAFALSVRKQQMATLKECIKLGFSTHQPAISDLWNQKLRPRALRDFPMSRIVSPMEYVIMYNMRPKPEMLYESGACSNKELFRMYTALLEPPVPKNSRASDKVGVFPFLSEEERRYAYLTLPYLKVIATSPRTLKSMCRLVISHSLDVRGKLHRDVSCLHLPESLKDYVMFSDLTRPDIQLEAVGELIKDSDKGIWLPA